jgi:hypothetical protein
MKKVSLGFGLALILALALTITAFAEAVTVTGTVTAVDEVGGTFTILLADGVTSYVVTPPAGFDWTSIAVGDSVDVSGESDGAGNLAASSVTDTPSTVTGVVQSIDYATCTFTILTAEGTTLTVTSPEGTDCSAILLGTTVELTGTLNPDGTFTVTGIVLVPTEVGEGTNKGFYCTNPTVMHPALSMVATSAGFDYGTALNWFCGATGGEDGGKTVLGIGEIKKLLELSAASGQTPDAIIAMRQTMGWGQIKKLLAENPLLTTEETTLTTEPTTGNGNGNGNGHGGGKPPWAGGGGNGGNGHGHGKNK